MPDRSYNLFIGGEECQSTSSGKLQIRNPANGNIVAQAPDGSAEDIDAAVRSARDAFPGWADVNPRDRAKILSRIASMIHENFDRLVDIEVSEVGRPISEIQTVDVGDTADCFDYYASATRLRKGETIPLDAPYFDFTLWEPIGVVAQIVPWNFPFNLAAWKVAPALAVGNCVVLKPSELTPSSAYELARITTEAGLPPGVLNVVSGMGRGAGSALVDHDDVDMIAFTGSVDSGRAVAEAAGRGGKRVSLELGGKSAIIVFDDCHVEGAIASVLEAAFFAGGENCCAGSRLLISESIKDEFLATLVERARGLKVGLPTDPETQVGCLISNEHLDRVMTLLKIAQDDGGRVVTGGKAANGHELAGGPFLEPTIVTDAPHQSTIVQKEVFGPVLAVETFSSDEQAVQLANSTQYDLAAGIWTKDVSRAHALSRRLRAGSVWVNTFNRVFNDAPFGGVKGSGYGRDLGTQAMKQYSNVKNVCICYEPGSDSWF